MCEKKGIQKQKKKMEKASFNDCVFMEGNEITINRQKFDNEYTRSAIDKYIRQNKDDWEGAQLQHDSGNGRLNKIVFDIEEDAHLVYNNLFGIFVTNQTPTVEGEDISSPIHYPSIPQPDVFDENVELNGNSVKVIGDLGYDAIKQFIESVEKEWGVKEVANEGDKKIMTFESNDMAQIFHDALSQTWKDVKDKPPRALKRSHPEEEKPRHPIDCYPRPLVRDSVPVPVVEINEEEETEYEFEDGVKLKGGVLEILYQKMNSSKCKAIANYGLEKGQHWKAEVTKEPSSGRIVQYNFKDPKTATELYQKLKLVYEKA